MYNGTIKIINTIPLLREYGVTEYLKGYNGTHDLEEEEYYQVEPLNLTHYRLALSGFKGSYDDDSFIFEVPRKLLRDSYRHRHIVCVPC